MVRVVIITCMYEPVSANLYLYTNCFKGSFCPRSTFLTLLIDNFKVNHTAIRPYSYERFQLFYVKNVPNETILV